MVSPLEPNLKAHAAFLETSGHQNLPGLRSGTTTEKGAFLGAEKLQKPTSENEREKKPLHSHLASIRERREESEKTTGAIDLHVKRKSLQIDTVRAKS